MLQMVFWPITDDEDVRDKEEDWECCSGTIHSMFGALLFLLFDFLALPLILSAYVAILFQNPDSSIAEINFLVPITALSLAIMISPFGMIAFARLYLCLYEHKCSLLHKNIIVGSMRIYLARVILYTFFSISWSAYTLWRVLQGCYWIICLRNASLFTFWAMLSLHYSIGCCLCCKALGFMRERYLGMWDNDPKQLDKELFPDESDY